MPGNHELDRLDRLADSLLDAALPGYAEAEPRPGLERRIIVSAQAERPRRFRMFAAWALAIPAVGCLLLFFLLPLTRHNPRLRPRVATGAAFRTNTPGTSAPAIVARDRPPAVAIAPRSRSSARPVSQQALPKQDVFPTPSPLTAEERALVAFNRVPIQPLKQPGDAVAQIDPVHIAELQILPLDVNTLDISDSTESNPTNNQP
jgi:hypothetical protein